MLPRGAARSPQTWDFGLPRGPEKGLPGLRRRQGVEGALDRQLRRLVGRAHDPVQVRLLLQPHAVLPGEGASGVHAEAQDRRPGGDDALGQTWLAGVVEDGGVQVPSPAWKTLAMSRPSCAARAWMRCSTSTMRERGTPRPGCSSWGPGCRRPPGPPCGRPTGGPARRPRGGAHLGGAGLQEHLQDAPGLLGEGPGQPFQLHQEHRLRLRRVVAEPALAQGPDGGAVDELQGRGMIPAAITAEAPAPAPATLPKRARSVLTDSMRGRRRTVTPVTKARFPSEPVSKPLRSYPGAFAPSG